MLWLVLVGLLAGGYYVLFTLPNSQRQEITLEFHDANEIIRGTNVRLMGVDVGVVDDVRIEDEHVNVKIRMTREAIQIPEGTTATIKFTGLVGSKSLELMPPEQVEDSGPSMKPPNAYVIVEEPIRLRDTIQYNIDIAKALQHGAENFSDFFGRRKSIEELQYNTVMSQEKTRAVVDFLDRSLVNVSNFEERFLRSRSEYHRMFYHLEEGSLKAVDILDRKIFGPSVQPVLNYFDDVFWEAQQRLDDFHKNGYYTLESRIIQVRERLSTAQYEFQGWDFIQKAGRLESGLDTWHQFVEKADRFLSKDTLPKLHQTQTKIQNFNTEIDTLNQRI